MNYQQILHILEDYKRIFDQVDISTSFDVNERFNRSYSKDQITDFIYDLTEISNKSNIILLQNGVSPTELIKYLKDLLFPILLFVRENDQWVPLSVYAYAHKKSKIVKYYKDGKEEQKNLPPLEAFLKDENGEVLMLAAFQFNSLVSPDEEEGDPSKKLSPVQRLSMLLSAEKRDITYIYIYAVFIGIISMVMPLGVQGIIGQIAGGVEISTIWILISLVILAVIIGGGLQVMQLYIVEMIQRRVFAKGSYEFAFRIPRFKIEAIQKFYAPELINRFFDILTVQKGLPKLLIEISTAALQILFGLILLSFYHSIFLSFGLILIFVLGLIFYFTSPKGLNTALVTSKYKYKVVYWLEEMARSLKAFKMAGNTNLPIIKADNNLNHYLTYRHKHFKVLVGQYVLIVLFKTLVIGGLLIIGSMLVIDRQITLGQFVASELVVIIIINAVEKIIMYIETVYDMLTAVEKIGQVTDLPLEKSGGVNLPANYLNGGLYVKVKNLKYKFEGSDKYALNGVDLEISPGKKVGVTGPNGAGTSTLANILSGIFTDYEGIVAYNNIPLRDMNLMNLRNNIARNISLDDVFEGTILENMNIGRQNADYNDALMTAEKINLLDFIQSLPKGLHTEVTSGGKNFSNSVIQKIILARCMIKNPKFLILNDFFIPFNETEKQQLIKLVIKDAPWTLLVVTKDPMVLSACDKVIVMEEGIVKEIKEN